MTLVSRIHLAVVGLALLVALGAGVALQLELWSPEPLWRAELYGRLLAFHGAGATAIGASALAGCAGYAAIGADRMRAPALAWIGLGLWVLGLAAALVFALRSSDDTSWTLYTPYSADAGPPGLRAYQLARLAFAASGLVFAAHFIVLLFRAPRSAARLALAIAFVLAIGAASLRLLLATLTTDALLAGAYTAAPAPVPFTLFAGLVLATLAAAGPTPHRVLAPIALGTALLATFTPLHFVSLFLVALWIALAVQAGIRRPAAALVLAGAAPTLLAVTALRLLTASRAVDIHLHDTHAEVALYHAIAAAIAFGALALAPARHAALAWLGTALTSGGFLVHIYAGLALGGAGMPRRYWSYDPTFTTHHQLSGIAAGLALAGILVLAIGYLVKPSPNRLRT